MHLFQDLLLGLVKYLLLLLLQMERMELHRELIVVGPQR